MDPKMLIRKLMPPLILDVRARAIKRAARRRTIGRKPFLSWWEMNRNEADCPQALREIVDHFVETPEAFLMSDYWWFLAKRNIEELQNVGYANFKQTVARNYYTWVGDEANLLLGNVDIAAAMKRVGSMTIPMREIFRKHDHFTLKESIAFNLNTLLMYCALGTPATVDEPTEGNPPGTHIEGRLVTQDQLNALLDYQSISKCFDLVKARTVLELGAGYGRTAYRLLSLHPHLAYVVIDIPPALYVAQEYLPHQFPDKPAVPFSRTRERDEVKDAISNKALIFLTPDQLKLLDDRSIDLWIAIDNLQEMTMRQVSAYLDQIHRVARSLYFTYRPGTQMPFDEHTHDVRRWPIPATWKLKSEESAYIPSGYKNVFYETD
jgi:putative sugar O-methyltransferase